MTAGDLRLVPAVGSGTEEAERLLDAAGLPTGDLEDTALSVAVDADGTRVGVGGVEPHVPHGLLRSVAVREDRRGEGLGRELVRALEREAREAGLVDLSLLTTDTAGFFEGLGYEEVPREDVPEAVRESTQFTTVCPDSATAMWKSL